MALAEPTTEESDGWKVLGDMLAWTSLQGEATDENSEAGSLLKLLGATADTPIRVLGAITETDLAAVIEEWRPGGVPPTPITRSKAAILGRGARIASGLEPSRIEREKNEELRLERKHEIALANAQPMQAPNSSLPLPPGEGLLALDNQTRHPVSMQKKVKMNLVVDQVYDQEIDCLGEEEVLKLYKTILTSSATCLLQRRR